MAVDGEVIVLEQPVSTVEVQLERRVTNTSRDRDNALLEIHTSQK